MRRLHWYFALVHRPRAVFLPSRKPDVKKPRRSGRGASDADADVSAVEPIELGSEDAVDGETSPHFEPPAPVVAKPQHDERHQTPESEWGPRVRDRPATTTPPGTPPPNLSYLGTPWFQDEPCRVYTVDSLGGKHKAVVTALGKYLGQEALVKKRCTAPVPAEALLEVKGKVRPRWCRRR